MRNIKIFYKTNKSIHISAAKVQSDAFLLYKNNHNRYLVGMVCAFK